MKFLKTLSVTSLILGSAFFLEGYRENRQLETEHIKIQANKFAHKNSKIKIAHLSDTQFPRLRVKTKKLLTKLTNEKPDLIFFTGDTIDRTESMDTTEFTYFLKQLTKIAPTYIVSGNHEITNTDYQKWLAVVKNSEAILLENDAQEIEVNGEVINIIGLSENQTALKSSVKAEINPDLESFLLAHHPEKIESYVKNFNEFSFTAFSGHAHGGQIILPILGGILSPNQGFFPDYTDGLYELDSKKIIVSRGLANSSFPARINNYPHLIFVEVTG